jgi:hypothetical protein
VASTSLNTGNAGGPTFKALGIRSARTTEIKIEHPPIDITGGTIEIPGDVLIKDARTIVFPVCGVFFEAVRRN